MNTQPQQDPMDVASEIADLQAKLSVAREKMKYIAEHNIFTEAQYDVREFAKQALAQIEGTSK